MGLEVLVISPMRSNAQRLKAVNIALYNNLVKMEDVVCCRAFKRDCEIRRVIGSLES